MIFLKGFPQFLNSLEEKCPFVQNELEKFYKMVVRGPQTTDIFPELSKQWMELANQRMNSEQISKLPVTYDRVDIRDSLKKLKPGTEINDDVINGYLSLIQATLPASRFIASTRLLSPTRPSPQDRQLDPSVHTKIMLPICSRGHWSFAVIHGNINRKVVQHYNSFNNGEYAAFPEPLRDWLGKKKIEYDISEPESNPQQSGGKDCGLYVLLGIRMIAAGSKSTMQNQEALDFIPLFRTRVMAELLAGCLNPSEEDYQAFLKREATESRNSKMAVVKSPPETSPSRYVYASLFNAILRLFEMPPPQSGTLFYPLGRKDIDPKHKDLWPSGNPNAVTVSRYKAIIEQMLPDCLMLDVQLLVDKAIKSPKIKEKHRRILVPIVLMGPVHIGFVEIQLAVRPVCVTLHKHFDTDAANDQAWLSKLESWIRKEVPEDFEIDSSTIQSQVMIDLADAVPITLLQMRLGPKAPPLRTVNIHVLRAHILTEILLGCSVLDNYEWLTSLSFFPGTASLRGQDSERLRRLTHPPGHDEAPSDAPVPMLSLAQRRKLLGLSPPKIVPKRTAVPSPMSGSDLSSPELDICLENDENGVMILTIQGGHLPALSPADVEEILVAAVEGGGNDRVGLFQFYGDYESYRRKSSFKLDFKHSYLAQHLKYQDQLIYATSSIGGPRTCADVQWSPGGFSDPEPAAHRFEKEIIDGRFVDFPYASNIPSAHDEHLRLPSPLVRGISYVSTTYGTFFLYTQKVFCPGELTFAQVQFSLQKRHHLTCANCINCCMVHSQFGL